MHLGIVLFRYFPFGGQQRDMLAIAREALERGHAVTVVCHHWQGERPEGLAVVEVDVSGFTNHRRMASLAKRARDRLRARHVDLVLGFVKIPGLDVYFAADPCFAEKARRRGPLYRLAPRTRTYLALEAAVFGADSSTHVLEIAPRDRAVYTRHYGTPDARFHTLRPGIDRDRRVPEDYPVVRRRVRESLGLDDDTICLLALGSGFRTKGLDRSIRTLRELRRRGCAARLLVAGDDRAGPFSRLARKQGVERHVEFLGGREDIPELLQAADLLLHPAYREAAGNALLEAAIAGLPVVATRTCGYSHYIEEATMGVVVPDDAGAVQLADAAESLLAVESGEWRRRGRVFADSADLYDRSGQAVDILESLGENR